MKILRYRSLEEIPNYHKKSVPIDTINFLIFTLISIKKKKRKVRFHIERWFAWKIGPEDRRGWEAGVAVARISRGKYASQACKVNCWRVGVSLS